MMDESCYSAVRKAYDKIYASSSKPVFGKGADNLLGHALRYKKSGSALDVGCGDGRCSIFLAKKGFRVLGIDISTEAIKKAHIYSDAAKITARFINGNFLSCKITGKFDLITMYMVLHHLKSRDKISALRKIIEHTNSDGINFIAFRTDVSRRFESKIGSIYRNYGWKVLEQSREYNAKKLDGSELRFRFIIAVNEEKNVK